MQNKVIWIAFESHFQGFGTPANHVQSHYPQMEAFWNGGEPCRQWGPSKSTAVAQGMQLKLKCTWVLEQDKDPVNTPARPPLDGLKKTSPFRAALSKSRLESD